MDEDNLGIELISKEGITNALIPIMSELSIDADAQGKILLTIMNQKVAYDIENVVAELEERRTKNDCQVCRHFQNGKAECMEDCTDALIDDLLDIVRKGGINETD